MAPHSSTLAWKILWTEEPSRLQSMRSLKVGYDWATSLLLVTFMHWRRQWQPTPVFLPGESQGWGSQVGCRLLGRTELDTIEAMQQQQQQWASEVGPEGAVPWNWTLNLWDLMLFPGSIKIWIVGPQKIVGWFWENSQIELVVRTLITLYADSQHTHLSFHSFD